jgi:hypothetical protein
MNLSRQTCKRGNPVFSEMFIDLLYEKPSAFESALMEIIMGCNTQLHTLMIVGLFIGSFSKVVLIIASKEMRI